MANELQCRTGVTGQAANVYFLLRNAVGQVRNASAFVTYASADRSSYDISSGEVGNTGEYLGSMPSGVASGRYRYESFFASVAGSPSDYDVLLTEQWFDWDGSAVVGSSGANIKKVNDVTVGGTGTAVDPWGPA